MRSVPFTIFIVFLVLKLAEVSPIAHWSWWWVTSPLWIPWAIVFPIVMLFGSVLGLAAWAEKQGDKGDDA